MTWLPIPVGLVRDPRVKRLARRLGVSVPTAVGHLVALWGWAMEYAAEGNLSQFEADELAEAALWEDDPTLFLDGLVAAGFVERDEGALRVAGWGELGGKILAGREAHRERQRAYRERHSPAPRDDHAPATCPSRDALDQSRLRIDLSDQSRRDDDGSTFSDFEGAKEAITREADLMDTDFELAREFGRLLMDDAAGAAAFLAERTELRRRLGTVGDELLDELWRTSDSMAELAARCRDLESVLARWGPVVGRAATPVEVRAFADMLISCSVEGGDHLQLAIAETAARAAHPNVRYVAKTFGDVARGSEFWHPVGVVAGLEREADDG